MHVCVCGMAAKVMTQMREYAKERLATAQNVRRVTRKLIRCFGDESTVATAASSSADPAAPQRYAPAKGKGAA